MNFLPEEIENLIIDYKKQFERKYDCSIRHKHELFETRKVKNITFYKNPYKFECEDCKMKICGNHSDEFIKKNTKEGKCNTCNIVHVQIKEILKDIKVDKIKLIECLKSLKSMLFYFNEEHLIKLNKKIKDIYYHLGTYDENQVYESVHSIYSSLTFFNFFEGED